MRKSVKQVLAAAVMCSMMVAISGAATPQPLPFAEDFQAGSIDTSAWATGTLGIVSLTTASDAKLGGSSQVSSITNSSMTVEVVSSAGDPANIWGQVYASPAEYTGDPAATEIEGLAAVFYVDANGWLRAMNGYGNNAGEWTNVVDLGATGWEGFVAHLDYINYEWDLYRQTSGKAGAATLTRVAAGLGFYSNLTEFSSFEVSTELTTLIDEIGLVRGYSDASNDLYSVVKSTKNDHNPDEWQERAIGAITYSYPDNVVTGVLGGDLMMGMAEDDQIRLYHSVLGFDTFSFNGGAWFHSTGDPDRQIQPGEYVWVKYDSNTTDVLEFWAEGFGLNAGDSYPDNSGSVTILGASGTSGVGGWNHVAYGGANSTTDAPNGLEGILEVGDLVYLATPNTTAYRRYYMLADGLYRNGAPASPDLRNGARLWIMKAGNDSSDWVIP
jgi:hypothetical protein